MGVESGWGILRDTEYLKYNPHDQAESSAVFLNLRPLTFCNRQHAIIIRYDWLILETLKDIMRSVRGNRQSSTLFGLGMTLMRRFK